MIIYPVPLKPFGIPSSSNISTEIKQPECNTRSDKLVMPATDTLKAYNMLTFTGQYNIDWMDDVKVTFSPDHYYDEYVGKATIFLKPEYSGDKERKITVDIVRTFTGDDDEKYYLEYLDDKIGYAVIHDPSRHHSKYEEDAIEVYDMDSSQNDKYKGVGTAFHKMAVALSYYRGYEGKVLLSATNGAHKFHYRFGFKPVDNDEQPAKKIEANIRKSIRLNLPTDDLGLVNMYLPKKAAQKALKNTLTM